MKNLLVGNGVNIQHDGYEYSNGSILKRTLLNYDKEDYPKHILGDEPILGNIYLYQLFETASDIIDDKFDDLTNCTVERRALDEFKVKYASKLIKITDIGFEDFYLLHDLVCHKCNITNPDMYNVRNSLEGSFIHAIYNDGEINEIHKKFSVQFINWVRQFDSIFTTNYDENIDKVTDVKVNHLHGDFKTLKDIYDPKSFRNMLSDCPIRECKVDEEFQHLYTTAISTHSGDYKEMIMKQKK